MNELKEYAALQALRGEVAEPTPNQLAPAFARLDRAMREATEAKLNASTAASAAATAASAAASAVSGSGGTPSAAAPIPNPVPATSHVANPRSRVRRRVGWSLGAVGGALALTLVGGNAAMAIESARASELLREIAGITVGFDDAELAPGQYLRSSTRADWGTVSGDESDPDSATYTPNEQQIDVYMPLDPSDDWVLVRDWGTGEAVSAGKGSGVHTERLTAPYGAFYAGLGDPVPGTAPRVGPESGWLGVDPADIPTESGEAAYGWIDARYGGGSASRAEDNYERITALLRTGLMPAPQRAALLEALGLVPGVSSTVGVENLDGVTGVAFGRTEALHDGARSEIIVDPATGLIIGERSVTGISVFGYGPNEVVGSTAIETSVVDADF